MSTPQGEISFEIDGVQVEVDAGYEGDQVYLIEAKMGETENFHMRQLFYPYRMWQAEGVTKNIIPIFLSYYNGIVSLTQYKFTNDAYYDSYQVVKSKQYTFETDPVANSLVEILDCISFAQTTETNGAPPFPQANDLRKVRDVIDLIYCEINTKDTIAAYWDLEPRQGDYYANAAAYLGYIEKEHGSWVLTEKGLNYVSLPTSKRKRAFILSILKRTVFYVLTKKMIESDSVPERNVIKDVILEYININEVTANRRASTVKSWLVFIRNYFS
nr:AAA-associated domain-containing protein [sulfur-oxidizing endosymbiont of Gigantopelta aegis]